MEISEIDLSVCQACVSKLTEAQHRIDELEALGKSTVLEKLTMPELIMMRHGQQDRLDSLRGQNATLAEQLKAANEEREALYLLMVDDPKWKKVADSVLANHRARVGGG
jgi:hypothetical protein